MKFRFPKFRLATLFFLVLIIAIVGAWRRDHQRLQAIIDELQNPGPSWGTHEALGPPNTVSAGDCPTAWASKTQDGQREWLVLEFGRTVQPTELVIHETYNPGAVDRVTILREDGSEVLAWSGIDPTPTASGMGVSRIPLPRDSSVQRVKLYIDSPKVPGWNEIDAVGLVDRKGGVHWAEKAYSSSAFGRNNPLPSTWQRLLK